LRYNLLVIGRKDLNLTEAIMSTLSGAGFRVANCSDHLAALSKLAQLKPDLVILGEGLLVDSFEACRQLRQVLDVPVVMVGKTPRAEGWVKAVQSGADCYLAKPFYHSELVARVKAILRRREWSLTEGKFNKDGGRA